MELNALLTHPMTVGVVCPIITGYILINMQNNIKPINSIVKNTLIRLIKYLLPTGLLIYFFSTSDISKTFIISVAILFLQLAVMFIIDIFTSVRFINSILFRNIDILKHNHTASTTLASHISRLIDSQRQQQEFIRSLRDEIAELKQIQTRLQQAKQTRQAPQAEESPSKNSSL
jgi:hypothetical protein